MDKWKEAIDKHNVKGDNVVHHNLPENQQTAIQGSLNVISYPTYMLIDREGNVLGLNVDPHHGVDKLKRLLDRLK